MRSTNFLYKLFIKLVLVNVFFATSAFSADGEWNLSPWSYSDNTAVDSSISLSTSQINSAGVPSIGLQVRQTTMGSISAQSIGGTASTAMSSIQQMETTLAPTSHAVTTQLIFNPAVATFGAAAGQGNVFAGKNGFTLRFRPIFGGALTQSSTITVTLAGGAVFAAVGASGLNKYQISAGGVGASFVTYSWNPAATQVGNFLFLDGLILNGPVSSITVERAGVYGGSANSSPETLSISTRIDPSALPLPVVQSVPTLSEWAMLWMASLMGLFAFLRLRRH